MILSLMCNRITLFRKVRWFDYVTHHGSCIIMLNRVHDNNDNVCVYIMHICACDCMCLCTCTFVHMCLFCIFAGECICVSVIC